jgi:pimeloyl-ACP methyl ester carboxylesterase
VSASSGNRSTATALLVAAAICAGCASPAGSPEPKAAVTLSEWGPCAPTEPAGVECSTLTVPFDYARPDERTFTIPLVRIAARSEKPRLLLTNPGGPGISGVGDLRSNREYFAGFTDTHTVVSFDPRGVGGSEPALSCLDDQQRQAIFNQPSVPTTEPQMTRAAALAAGIGDACERRFTDALAHVGTADVARDMDEIRKALGFERIDYLGYSYGTFLGAVYADTFPGHFDRVVLDSVMDPKLDYAGVRRGQARGMQHSVTAFAEDCLRQPQCALTGNPDQAVRQISAIIADLDREPYVGSDGRTLSGARMLALVESSQYFPTSGWPSLRDTLDHAVSGDWPAVLEAAHSPDLMVNPADSQYLSVVCIDFQADRDHQAPRTFAPVWATESPVSGGNRAWSLQPCETWPAGPAREPGPVQADGAGQVLILSTTGDPATPLSWAQSLHDQIEGSTLVVVPAEGHIASAQSGCAEDALTAFLRRGELPPGPVYTCPANS